MNNDLDMAFATLRERYCSHYQAAVNIGIAPDHYRKMRNGRANIPQRTADYIILKAKEVQSMQAQDQRESLTQPVSS